MNNIYNEDCFITMNRLQKQSIDLILTAPPFFKIQEQEYIDWTIELFNGFNIKLKPNGCILYNLSYNTKNTHFIWLLVADIIRHTDFTVADCITWKKENPIINNRNKNKLDIITDYIFVFCRKEEIKTFNTNKTPVSFSEKTDKPTAFEYVNNYIESPNNDEYNKLNKETFSTDLVLKLLNIYGIKDGTVYDPFIGLGTTAKGAIQFGMNFIGSEIDYKQVDYANMNIHKVNIVNKEIKKVIKNVDDDFWNR